MSFFNEYPYTNLHELNLDYILKSIKELWDYVKSDKWRGEVIFNSIYNEELEQIKFIEYNQENNDLTDKPNLSAVAITGSYNDLTDKPNLSAVATSGSYNDLIDKPKNPTITYDNLNSIEIVTE